VKTGTFYATYPDGKPDVIGDYTIIYTATDSFGNMAVVTRTVRVQDTEAPGITLKGAASANICRWSDYVDEGYTVTDNYWKGTDITVTPDGNYESTQQEGIYSLRYKAVDKSGNTSYSAWRLINVLPAGEGKCATSVASGDLDKNITVYPNPTRGQVYVSVELPQSQVVTLTVTNALGEVVARADNENVLSKTFKIDLSGQAAGVYLVHISTGKQMIVKKIIMSN
jgi:hypothetical protein